MSTPVPPDPTGKRGRLSATRVALSLALAAALAAGVLKSPGGPTAPPPPPPDSTVVTPPPPDTSSPPPPVTVPPGVDTLAAVHKWQCPDSLPEAVVLNVADISSATVKGDTLSYVPTIAHPANQQSPVVLCGPATMVRRLLATPETGHGAPAVLHPPSPTAVTYTVPSLTTVNGHLVAPTNPAALMNASVTRVVVAMMSASGQPLDTTKLETRVGIMELADSLTTRASTGGAQYLRYLPARGTRQRSFLAENAGRCWGGDPDPFCAANGGSVPDRTLTSWLSEWPQLASPPADRVLRLVAIRSDGTTQPLATP